MNRVSVNVDSMEMYVIQSKDGTMINFNVNVKNRLIGVLLKNVTLNPSTCYFECNKRHGIGEYLDIKNCTCKEPDRDNLVSTCEDEVLITIGTASISDKKRKLASSHYFICNLVFIFVSCHF